MLGDPHGVKLVGVFGEGFTGSCGDGGLADSALLVADDDPLGVFRPGHRGRRVGLQPHLHGLGQPLDDRDATRGAVIAEVVPLALGEKGRERLGAGRVDGGKVGAEPTPCLDTGFDCVLDVDAVLGCPDLQILLQHGGQLGDDLVAVAGEGEVMPDTLLTSKINGSTDTLALSCPRVNRHHPRGITP